MLRFKDDIVDRSFAFAVRVVKMARELAAEPVGRIVAGQVVRSASSIGANVEEAQAADTGKEFARCMTIVKKEARETLYWLRLIRETGLLPAERLGRLIEECEAVGRILYAIVKTPRESAKAGRGAKTQHLAPST
ncbi:MAG: four helix bundle protein [Phycisphaerae bacterium]